MKSKLLFLTIFLFLFSSFVFTQEQRGVLNLDESLTRSMPVNYEMPKKIQVVHLQPTHEHFLRDSESWLRLYHYYITTRFEISDIPFNYIIDELGIVYEILENSEGKVPYIGADEGAVLIGYLAKEPEFTLSAQESFRELIEKYSYKFGISRTNVEPVELEMSKDAPTIKNKPAEGTFRLNFLRMARNFEYSEEANFRFAGAIEDLKYPNNVKIGEKVKVEFVLKNNDSSPWYVDDGFVFLTTADGEDSPFAVNQEWDSFSKPFALEKQTIFPGDSVELSFELDTIGRVPGKYDAAFKFVMLPDIDVEGAFFNLAFEIDRGDSKVVQIRPTGTGALTVYKCPGYTCAMVAAAISGQRYLVLEEEELWYKINVDGVEGWVTVHYATIVN